MEHINAEILLPGTTVHRHNKARYTASQVAAPPPLGMSEIQIPKLHRMAFFKRRLGTLLEKPVWKTQYARGPYRLGDLDLL